MNKQPEALRLAEWIECNDASMEAQNKVAAELRRLHQSEQEGWRYAAELEQERERLHEVNQELLKSLKTIMGDAHHGQNMTWEQRCMQARAAIATATGETT